MKRENFKVTISAEDELVTENEKGLTISITNNNDRQWITLFRLTRDELMQLHDDIEKFFLEGMTAQTLAKRLKLMEEGDELNINAISENGTKFQWQVKKITVIGCETFFAGIVGISSTVGSFDIEPQIEKLGQTIFEFIKEVSDTFYKGEKFTFEFDDK